MLSGLAPEAASREAATAEHASLTASFATRQALFWRRHSLSTRAEGAERPT